MGVENIKNTILDTDPTTFSPASLTEGTLVGYTEEGNYPIIESDGVQYVELENDRRHGSLEQVITRTLKGIVNVSDIVEGTDSLAGRYFSKIMPLDQIHQPTSVDEIKADIALIETLFGDVDRKFHENANGINYIKNLVFNGSAVAYFDFGGAQPGLFNRHPLLGTYGSYSQETLVILLNKATKLQEQVQGEPGKIFLERIVKKLSAQSLNPPYSEFNHTELTKLLQNTLLSKIKILEREVKMVLRKKAI